MGKKKSFDGFRIAYMVLDAMLIASIIINIAAVLITLFRDD